MAGLDGGVRCCPFETPYHHLTDGHPQTATYSDTVHNLQLRSSIEGKSSHIMIPRQWDLFFMLCIFLVKHDVFAHLLVVWKEI